MFVHLNLQSCVQPCACSPWSSWTKGGVCLRVGSVGTSADASGQSTAPHRAGTWTRLWPWLSERPLYTADREGTRDDVSCGGRNFIPTFVIRFSVEKDRKCHQDLWGVAGKKRDQEIKCKAVENVWDKIHLFNRSTMSLCEVSSQLVPSCWRLSSVCTWLRKRPPTLFVLFQWLQPNCTKRLSCFQIKTLTLAATL